MDIYTEVVKLVKIGTQVEVTQLISTQSRVEVTISETCQNYFTRKHRNQGLKSSFKRKFGDC